MEELLGLLILRWGTAAAGLIVAIVAYHRASRRIDLPNQLHAEVTKLKADLKSVVLSVEQTIAAVEDRFTAAQKRTAAYASHEARRGPAQGVIAPGPGDPAAVRSVEGGNGESINSLVRADPATVREAVRGSRLGGG